MFLGWYDPDKKKSADDKLADACARYRDKFGADPEAVLANPADADEITPGDLAIRPVGFLPRHTFYVGVEGD